jgi:hypothetical protein
MNIKNTLFISIFRQKSPENKINQIKCCFINAEEVSITKPCIKERNDVTTVGLSSQTKQIMHDQNCKN